MPSPFPFPPFPPPFPPFPPVPLPLVDVLVGVAVPVGVAVLVGLVVSVGVAVGDEVTFCGCTKIVTTVFFCWTEVAAGFWS